MFKNWIRARVVDKQRAGAFGVEITVRYEGMVFDSCHGPVFGRGTSSWIPIASDDLSIERPNDKRICREEMPMDSEAELTTAHAGIAEEDIAVYDGEERYARRLKSRRKRKGKRKSKRKYRSYGKHDDRSSLKRVERKLQKYNKIDVARLCVPMSAADAVFCVPRSVACCL